MNQETIKDLINDLIILKEAINNNDLKDAIQLVEDIVEDLKIILIIS